MQLGPHRKMMLAGNSAECQDGKDHYQLEAPVKIVNGEWYVPIGLLQHLVPGTFNDQASLNRVTFNPAKAILVPFKRPKKFP